MPNDNDKHVFTCPECGCGLQTKRAMIGTEAQCPKCRATITIPQGD